MPPDLQKQSTQNSSDILNPVPINQGAAQAAAPEAASSQRSSTTHRPKPPKRRQSWGRRTVTPSSPSSGRAQSRPDAVPPTPAEADTEDQAWSPSVESVLEQPPSRLPQMLMLGGLLFVVSLGIWSWIGKFDQIGYANGKLIPQGELFKVHSAEAGKIVTLSVSEGQRLDEGELIAVLDNNLAKGEVDRLQEVVRSTEIQLLQQQQLLEQLRMEVQSRQYISDADIQAQQVAITQAALQVETSLGLMMQSQQDLIGYQERLARLEPLVVEGAIARERLFEIEQQMRDRYSSLIQNQGGVAQAQSEVEQLQAILQQRVAEGQRSQLESQQRVQGLLVQITELQGRLRENETLLRSAQSRLQQFFLYAPVSGVVSSLSIRNPGEVIQPGQTLMEMRSGDDPLVLEAFITSAEAGFVEVDMPVKVKFDAYPYQKFGVIPGKVIFTSPDSETDSQSGATVYRIKVRLDRHHIISEDEKVDFQAGQTATAEIIIRRRRIIDIVLEPIQQLRASKMSLDDSEADPGSSESSTPVQGGSELDSSVSDSPDADDSPSDGPQGGQGSPASPVSGAADSWSNP